MKKIFSYSLFEPKYLPSHRTWDKWHAESARYWYNIPAILLINKLLHSDYEVVFYLTPNIWHNPLSDIFKCFSDIRIETVDRDYKFTEPAIWRMMPVWERGVSILHTRDVDSLPSLSEYKYIKAFESSSCTVGTIRSHENHYGIACRMLAGLCSFKPDKISPIIKGMNFDFYYSQRKNEYGSDQNLMIKTFTSNPSFTKDNFLDLSIDKQKNNQDFPCIKADVVNIVVDNKHLKILETIQKFTKTQWLGEPCDSRGDLLKYLLEEDNEVRKNLLSNLTLKEFYRI
jgi:hypothetical protein